MSQKNSSAISDEQIIELYWARNEIAIEKTDEKYGKFLFSVAYNVLRDENDCEECKNDAYLDIWNAIPPRRPAVFQSFIAQIIRRIAIDRYREKKAKKSVPSELTACIDDLFDSLQSPDSVDDALSAKELGRLISKFLARLPEKEHYIFMARYYFAEPVDAIAAALRMTPSGVYKQLTKIKGELRKYLKGNGVYL